MEILIVFIYAFLILWGFFFFFWSASNIQYFKLHFKNGDKDSH